MSTRKVWIILTIGFLVGICVLLYPAFSSFWNSKTQSRAIVNYESVLENLEPEDYSAITYTPPSTSSRRFISVRPWGYSPLIPSRRLQASTIYSMFRSVNHPWAISNGFILSSRIFVIDLPGR